MPAPSVVGFADRRCPGAAGRLRATVLHSVLIGLAIGRGLGFVVGVLIDRSGTAARAAAVASLATRAAGGRGADRSHVVRLRLAQQAAVVVVMTFADAGQHAGRPGATGHMERDLMHSYGASYWRTLFSLRIPVALPFVFNALRSTRHWR